VRPGTGEAEQGGAAGSSGELGLSVALGVEEAGQIGVVETPAGSGGDARLAMVRDAEPGDGQHCQVVGPVADGDCLRQRDTGLGGESNQRRSLGLAGDDRGQHLAGDAAVDDLQPIGGYPLEAELGRDPVGKDREPAGDERRRGAVAPHRRDQSARSRGRADPSRGGVEHPSVGSRQQRDAGLERGHKVDLAVHRPPGDLGDARADPKDHGQFVEHLIRDDRRFEIGDEQPLAPITVRLDHDVDCSGGDDVARRFDDPRRAGRVDDEIAGFVGGEPDRPGRDRQRPGDGGGEAGKVGIASAGDQGEGDAHPRWSYALKRVGDKPPAANCEPGPRVVVIAGPTASGKSALALELAADMRGTVINADSMQCYRDLAILTARPGPAALARAPHRLYGFLDAAERGSAGSWRERVLAEIAAATSAGALPIVVGGTGLYIRALTHGLAPLPEISEAVRQEAAALRRLLGGAAFRRRLAELDPEAGRRLHPGDTQRLVRAYAVVRATGRPIAAWRAGPHPAAPCRFATIVLMPPRERLYAACDARFATMIGRGALAEAAAIAARGLDPGLPAMKAVGLPELIGHLRGELPLAEAVASAQRATRRYAKRQVTWFRHQLRADLIFAEQFSESLLQRSRQFIDEFLLTGRT
jgi:tRNA dimethylallyltransferase